MTNSLRGEGYPIPEFSQHVRDFLRERRARTVVEVGPDPQLQLASLLAPACARYVVVDLPEKARQTAGRYRMRHAMGTHNLELKEGDALNLGSLVPHADVVLLHNPLLDTAVTDEGTMWQHLRGPGLRQLTEPLATARQRGYAEFLRVASPGHVLTFHRASQSEGLIEMLTSDLGVDPSRIRKELLLYDLGALSNINWELVTVENPAAP